MTHQEVRSYLDALETHLDDRKRDVRAMKWTGSVLVLVGLVLILATSKGTAGLEWWVLLGPLFVLGLLASWLGRVIGKRMADKEFGPHEELLKRLIESAERARVEQTSATGSEDRPE